MSTCASHAQSQPFERVQPRTLHLGRHSVAHTWIRCELHTKPARALVLKTKPMFVFMNMLFQKTVIPRETTPAPGGEDFVVREEEEDHNHPEGGY